MRVIEREQIPLQPPGRDELDRTYAQLRQIHGEAYGWDPPEVAGLERLPSNRMRQYVRAWINEWDLLRLDPGYQPRISVAGLDLDLTDESRARGPRRGGLSHADGPDSRPPLPVRVRPQPSWPNEWAHPSGR